MKRALIVCFLWIYVLAALNSGAIANEPTPLAPAAGSASQQSDPAMERFLVQVGLLKLPPPQAVSAPVQLKSARQDWKRLVADKSAHFLTPLKIGDRSYAKGLGAHSKGLAVFVLNAPFTRFVADVGVDSNPDTVGRGSVEFVVRADGREVARTPVMRGGGGAQRIEVSLGGATELQLEVTDAGDGITCDQADWAEARVIDANGHAVYLGDALHSEGSSFLTQRRLPASFRYDGRPSEKILAQWPRQETHRTGSGGRALHELTWREPDGGLVVTWRVEVLPAASAFEFRWVFRNEGKQTTKILSEICALDLTAETPRSNTRLLKSSGGLHGNLQAPVTGFAVTETGLDSVVLSGEGGRSSNRDLPFFLLEAQREMRGILVGVGWSGQWEAKLGYPTSPHELELKVHVPGTVLALPPGETLLTPSVLFGTYKGDFTAGGNVLRRILFQNYVPKLNGQKPLPPVSWNSWFVLKNTITEEVLKRQADVAAELGVEYFCIDSGWFGDFPRDVGNWKVDAAKFPNGLRPIGEYIRSKGMKVGIWFEPERAEPNTQIAHEHPEWLQGKLVNLAHPAVNEWLFQAMRSVINELGAKWIRHDANINPLQFWEKMDSPQSRGLGQARYLAALYEQFDRLMKEFPDLLIEGCASGGRRIDLETLKRSHTFWKSDKTDDVPTFRFQGTGANQFLPGGMLNANLLEIGSKTDVQSLFCGPLGFGADWTRVPPEKLAMVKAHIAYFKSIRHLLNQDFYPLFPQSRDQTAWTGWQFHDPSTDETLCVVVRPEASRYSRASVQLHDLRPGRVYLVEPMGMTTFTCNSSELIEGWNLDLPEPGSSAVFRITPK